MTWGAVAAGVGGAVVGGLMNSNASSDAADTAADAQRYAADIQQQMYQQSRQDYLPYMGTGGNALAQMASLYGLYNPSYFQPGASLPWSPDRWDNNTNKATQQSAAPGGLAPGTILTMSPGMPGAQAQTLYDPLTQRTGGAPSAYGLLGSYDGIPRYTRLPDAAQQTGNVAGQTAAPTAAPAYTPQGYGGFESSPEYKLMQDALQFGLDRGTTGLDRAASASGGLLSGAQAKALAEFSQGLSAQYLQGAYGDYYNRLANLAGLGQTSTADVSGLGVNAAANAGNAIGQAGAYNAAGIVGSNNAWSNAINQGLYGLGQSGALNNLFSGSGNVSPSGNFGLSSGSGFDALYY